MCVKYKINLALTDGLGWSIDKYPGYAQLMLALNREARKRGIRIFCTGYGSSYGASAQGNGNLHAGSVHKNRTSYPDGEVYECQGEVGFRSRAHKLVNGSCLSNEGLYRSKEDELVRFVETVEPGALYLHNLDICSILDLDWTKRCPDCRKKWPNDDYMAEDGAAGAYAHFFNHLSDAMNTVKKDGYDASSDLMICAVSPGYTWYYLDDFTWEYSMKFWANVGKLLKNKNTVVTFREQFYNHSSNPLSNTTRRRFEVMRETFDSLCPDVQVADIYFGGSDGFYSDRLFTCVPVYNYTQKGVDTLISAAGHAFHEPLQLLNAEYSWNSENSAFYNVPREQRPENYFSMMAAQKAACYGITRPSELFEDGGFLDVACEKLYGPQVGAAMSDMFRLSGAGGLQPTPYLSTIDLMSSIFRIPPMATWYNELNAHEFTKLYDAYKEAARLTGEAAALTAGIKNIPGADETAVFIAENLTVNCAYLDAFCDYMGVRADLEQYIAGKADAANIENRITAIATIGAKLEAEYEESGLTATDYMGGSMRGRINAYTFLQSNARWMLECFREKKRFPSKIPPKREWF